MNKFYRELVRKPVFMCLLVLVIGFLLVEFSRLIPGNVGYHVGMVVGFVFLIGLFFLIFLGYYRNEFLIWALLLYEVILSPLLFSVEKFKILTFSATLDFFEVLFILCVLVWAASKRDLKCFRRNHLAVPVILFGLWVAISQFTGILRVGFVEEWAGIRFFVYIFLFFIMYDGIKTERQIKDLLSVLFISVSLLVFHNILEWAFVTGIGFRGDFFPLSILFGASLLLFYKLRTFNKGLLLFLVLFQLFFVIFIIQSRAIWVGLLSALLFLFYFRHRLGKKIYLGLLSLVIFILIIVAVLVNSLVFEGEMLRTFGDHAKGIINPAQDETGSWRFGTWKSAMEGVREHPIVGYGLGNHAPIRRGEIHFENLPKERQTTEQVCVHNTFISLLLQMGSIGLILFLWIILLAVIFFVRLKDKKNAFILGGAAALLYFFVSNMFGCQIRTSQFLLWFLLGFFSIFIKKDTIKNKLELFIVLALVVSLGVGAYLVNSEQGYGIMHKINIPETGDANAALGANYKYLLDNWNDEDTSILTNGAERDYSSLFFRKQHATLDLGQQEYISEIKLLFTQGKGEYYTNNFSIETSDQSVHLEKSFKVESEFWQNYQYSFSADKGTYSVYIAFVNDYEIEGLDTNLYLAEFNIDGNDIPFSEFEQHYGSRNGNKIWKFPAFGLISKDLSLESGNHNIKIVAKGTKSRDWPEMVIVVENKFNESVLIQDLGPEEIKTKSVSVTVDMSTRFIRIKPSSNRYSLLNEVIVN